MELYFWKDPDNGKTPVKEFIENDLEKEDAGKLWQRLKFFRELSVSSMWEAQNLKQYDKELDYIRVILKKIYCRIFCVIKGQSGILLHAFVKKSKKIPPREVEIAKRRLRIYRAISQRKK